MPPPYLAIFSRRKRWSLLQPPHLISSAQTIVCSPQHIGNLAELRRVVGELLRRNAASTHPHKLVLQSQVQSQG